MILTHDAVDVMRETLAKFLDEVDETIDALEAATAEPAPPSGEWPDATNTGVPPGTTLTPFSGTKELRSAGMVLEGLDISGDVVVHAPNCIVRKCRVKSRSFVGVWATGNATGLVVEDCEISGENPPGAGTKGVWLEKSGGWVRRCNIHHTEDGIYLSGSDHEISENYIHDLAAANEDPHHDGIQLSGGNSFDVLIEHNNVDLRTTDNACVTNGAVQRVTLHNNRLHGGGYTVYFDGRFGEGTLADITVADNHFGPHNFGYLSLELMPAGELTWSGNVDDATGETIPPPSGSVAPPEYGPLTDGILTTSTLDVLIGSPGVSPPRGALIGTIRGLDAEGNDVLLDEVILTNDAGGRFQVVGEALTTTDVLADFEDPGIPANLVWPRPVQYYDVTAELTAGEVTLPKTFRIRPRYPHIDPAGGEGCAVTQPTDMTQLYSALGVAENKIVDLGKMQGVHRQPSGASQLKPKLKAVSIVGYPNVCMRQHRAWVFRDGDDVVVRDMAFRCGLPSTIQDVDNITIGEGCTDWVRNMHFRNCSFSSSNDELLAVNDTDKDGGHGARHIRFSWCMFAEAFFAAGHSKGNQHNHGPALYGRCQDIVMDHCIIGSNDCRNPYISRGVCGVTVVNCFIFHWLEHANYAGVHMVGTDGTTVWHSSCRIEGNIFYPVGRPESSYGERKNAILMLKVKDGLTNVYVPNSGTRCNHFCNPSTDNFADDLLVLGDGITLSECVDFQINTGTPPFEWAASFEAELHPTGTAAERQALFELLMENCGNGSKYDQDIKALIREGTTRMNVTPQQHDGRYGVNWDGVGGSLGHGVC